MRLKGLLIYLIFAFSCAQAFGQETLFKKVTAEKSNINFSNRITETENVNIFRYDYLYNGGGVGIVDVNNDGLDDIYFSGNMVSDRLYLNKGNFVFEDITKSAGIKVDTWSSGVCVFDINLDGWDDIYVCQSGPNKSPQRKNLLFINQQNNTFKEEGANYNLDLNGYFTQAAPLDYDLDGDLDLYVMGHPPTENLKLPLKEMLARIEKGEIESDRLMRNDNGVFTDVTIEAGIIDYGFGLGLAITDVNNDHYPDIIVANDFDEGDHYFINQQNGKFIDESLIRFKHTSNYSMGNDVGDINNDGFMDVITVDMAQINHVRSKVNMESMSPEKFKARLLLGWNYQYMHNVLQLNTGMGTYQEIAYLAGVAKTDWSWAPLFFDMDGDGWQDLFVSNGYKRDTKNNDIQNKILKEFEGNEENTPLMSLLELIPSENIANYFYRNNADLTFSDESKNWGVDEALKSNGAAYADLDNDGDLDLIVNNVDEISSVYENTSNLSQRTIIIDFSEVSLVDYLGAKISISTKKGEQFKEAYTVRGYQSTVSKKIHFHWEADDALKSIYIQYPDGSVDLQVNPAKNLIYKANKEVAKKQSVNYSAKTTFKNITKEIGVEVLHRENEFNDFENESLLPHKNSIEGPIIKVGDFNNDGLDDFILGSSTGKMPQIGLQQKDGKFKTLRIPAFGLNADAEDSDIHVFDLNKDGFQDLLITSGGYDKMNGDSLFNHRLYMGNGTGIFGLVKNAIPATTENAQKIIAEDFDKDGDLDFLVLGGGVPGKYPYASPIRFFRNDKGFYKSVEKEIFPDYSKQIGLLKDGMFYDIDGDGDQDFIGVGHWTGLEVFEFEKGVFNHFSSKILENGWWNKIVLSDVDGDGDLDFILGNAGMNNKFKPSKENPLAIYSNDFDGNGTQDLVLAYKNGKDLLPVRGKECSTEQMPFISEKFQTYESFATATLPDIYTKEKLNEALSFSVSEFHSGILKNNQGNWEFEPFPNLAQVSWLRDFEVMDVNEDGRLDIIGVGNHYGAEVETTNYDASAGIVLIQQDNGTFKALTNYNSGFYIHSDTREIESIHLVNHEKALIISSNNGYVSVFRVD